MRASDIMTKRVRTVSVDTPVRTIAGLMLKQRISALPVLDKKRRLVGIVSEGDLLRRPESGTAPRHSWWLDFLTESSVRAQEYAKSRARRAGDVMTRTVVSVTPDTEASEIADILEKWRIKRVPVMRGDKLVGIVSRRDLLPAIAKQRPRGRKVTDAAIGEAIKREIAANDWANDALVNIAVNKGVVQLMGLVASGEERQAFRVLAESIPGVRAVKDRLQVGPKLIYAV
jgi:CBS-domain-containing membrane protein